MVSLFLLIEEVALFHTDICDINHNTFLETKVYTTLKCSGPLWLMSSFLPFNFLFLLQSISNQYKSKQNKYNNCPHVSTVQIQYLSTNGNFISSVRLLISPSLLFF